MKKMMLNLILIINAICLIIYTANLFYRLPKFGELAQIIFSILSIISVVCIIKNKHLKISYYYLSSTYLLQSFSILFLSFTWKLLIGPDLTLYLFKEMDLTSKLDFKVFNLHFLVNTINNGENWSIGINFLHLIIFYYLIKYVKVLQHNNNVV